MSHAYFVFQRTAYPMPKDWAYKVSALMKEVHDPVYGDITSSAALNLCSTLPSAPEVNGAVAAVKTAWPAWSKTPVLRCARILGKFKNIMWDLADVAAILDFENGKTHDDVVGGVTHRLEVLEFAPKPSEHVPSASLKLIKETCRRRVQCGLRR